MSGPELYKIRTKGCEWANIFVDEQTGTFAAVSSYGNFAYIWTHIGTRTLKEFLVGLEYSYFFGKTAQTRGRVFSAEATTTDAKRQICESRRTGYLSKDEARDAWDAVSAIEAQNDVDYMREFSEDSSIMRVFRDCYWEMARTEKDPQCWGFWTTIWPVFCEQIRGRAAA